MKIDINNKSKETVKESFDKIARHIFNEIRLRINNELFEIVDIEFYYFSREHKDSYALKQEIKKGELYSHKYGIDISLTSDRSMFGGILIKGVINIGKGFLNKSKFKNTIINNLKIGTNEIEWLNGKYYEFDFINTVRENLGKPLENKDKLEFKEAKYRYIRKDKVVFDNLKGKEFVLRNSNIEIENWKLFLGYELKS